MVGLLANEKKVTFRALRPVQNQALSTTLCIASVEANLPGRCPLNGCVESWSLISEAKVAVVAVLVCDYLRP